MYTTPLCFTHFGNFLFLKKYKISTLLHENWKISPHKFDMHFTVQGSQQNFIPLKMICLLLMGFPFIFQASSIYRYIVFLDNSS